MTNYTNYRRKTTRLQHYDYSSGGYYFVTICTHEKRCLLGEIDGGKMTLSEIGAIVEGELLKTAEIRKNVEIDSFVIMPNHIHMIVVISESRTDMPPHVGTSNAFSKPISNSISMIINKFKGAVTKSCRGNGYHHFGWQPRFYEHVIRNEKELYAIRQYIENNPKNWEEDDENQGIP